MLWLNRLLLLENWALSSSNDSLHATAVSPCNVTCKCENKCTFLKNKTLFSLQGCAGD
ncbi:hypothetical protein OIU76_012378 [Salix suchowensis]|nr:hypothetical protein OIU76_012378 [Salix suchowensis]KAJ6325282.1 hypothetical protein OIU76_012378 [Salix suchowensis]KAJ6357755.1 hypothetical protein OIU78_005571 [Salix suchowensis]KAJ6357756.1 hypothetical protein OIU78_005571 [Salix suchowensis]